MFETDLLSTVNYITNVLKNEDAAIRLVDDIESAILKRLENPLAFKPYHSMKKRDYLAAAGLFVLLGHYLGKAVRHCGK